jgi:hypothetical protein
VTGKRHDLSTHQLVDIIFALKELVDDTLGLRQGASLMKEIREVSLSEPIDDQMGQMGDAIFR